MAKRPDGRVNIPRDVEDIYYRYHMPVLRARVRALLFAARNPRCRLIQDQRRAKTTNQEKALMVSV